MTDFAFQKFSDRLDQALLDGTLTHDVHLQAKAALEGAGMGAAMDVLKKAHTEQAGPVDDPGAPTDGLEDDSAGGEASDRVSFAEDLADLRDELNRDLSSERNLEIIMRISQAAMGRADLAQN